MLPLARQPESDLTGEWECMECGHIEVGVKARRPRACPECGAPANALEFFASGVTAEDWDFEAPSGDDFEEVTEDEDEF